MLNKRIYIKIIAVIAIIGFVLLTANVLRIRVNDSNAAVVSQVVYSDTFDSKEGALSNKWSPFGGGGLKVDYNAMRFNSENYVWAGHVINGKYKLEYDKIDSSCTVEFVIDKIDEGGQWIAFSFGTEDVTYEFPYSSGAIVFYQSGSNLFRSLNGALANVDGNDYVRPFKIFYGEKVKVLINFEKASEDKNYYISAQCISYQSGEVLSSHSYGLVRISDGYFGFNSASMKVDLFEFNVYEDENESAVFSDNFTNSAISFSNNVVENPTWYASNSWDETKLIAGTIGKLDISKVGGGVVYSDPIKEQEGNQLYLLYTLSADFYVDEMINADSGFIIGGDENGNNGTFVGLRKTQFKPQIVCYKVTNNTEVKNGLDSFSNSIISIRVKVFSNDSIEVAIQGNKYEFSIDKVSGYFGFITYAYGSGENKGAYVDNFEYSDNQYVNRATDDAKINFEDTIGTEIMETTVYDYYCPSNMWYKGNSVSMPIIVGENGYLIFTNSGDFDCFAPKKKYTDYIVRFDVTFDTVKNGSTFGIEVGKSDITESFSNSISIGFQKQGDETFYFGNKCLSVEGKSAAPIHSQQGGSENIFIKNETYNFMAIVNNGTIKLYIKHSSEDKSVLAYERARFTDIPTDGYVAMFAYNVSLRMDNFSVTNLDYEYFSEEVKEKEKSFRYDFSKGTNINDFSLISGGTYKKDKTLEIVRGIEGISTAKKYGGNITRIRFNDIEAGATYSHGNIVVKVDEANGRIIVSDGITDNIVKLESDFVYKNTLLQIEETLGKVSISFVSGDKSVAAITGNIYEFDVVNTLEESEVIVSSPYIATIKELSVFNLDTDVSIDSKVYVPQNVRLEKKSIQEEKGCSSSINDGLLVFLVLGIIGGAIMTIKRRGLNE